MKVQRKLETFLFGIDGLPSWMWQRFADDGIMPYSKRLLSQGRLVSMQSSLPEVSSAAWASIVTGLDPGGHNVFGFTDLMDGGYSLGFTSSRTFRAKPYWQQDDRNHLVMNVPQTYPALPLRGTLVSGFVALDLDRAVYPAERLPMFEELGYRVDADMSVIEASKERFVSDLNDVLDIRVAALDRLWDGEDWDSAMFVITGTDRLNHYLWEDFEDSNSQCHELFLDFYRKVDRVIESIVERLDDCTNLVVVSDHGFGRQRYSVNINHVLHDAGLLSVKTSQRPSYNDILPATKAFAMDPGRIYLNRATRYPDGSVADSDAEAVMQELTDYFSSYQVDGKPLVQRVLRGADIYSGPYAHRAPDLILMPETDMALSGRMNTELLVEPTLINGKHTFDHSTFYYRGAANIEFPEQMRVQDVLGIIRQAERRSVAA